MGKTLWNIHIVLIIGVLTSCKLGWTSLENKKYNTPTETKAFANLPETTQEFIKSKIKAGNYHTAFSNDPDYKIERYFLVSADYEGWPLRKTGHYIEMSGKKYFLNYQKGEPIIISDGMLYYTTELNLGKGQNQPENWLDSMQFYCVRLK